MDLWSLTFKSWLCCLQPCDLEQDTDLWDSVFSSAYWRIKLKSSGLHRHWRKVDIISTFRMHSLIGPVTDCFSITEIIFIISFPCARFDRRKDGEQWVLSSWGRAESKRESYSWEVWDGSNIFFFIVCFSLGPGLCSTLDYLPNKSGKGNQQKPLKLYFGIRIHFTNLAVYILI